tara:strand:- start:204 stop:833 length:630 start_codon:yes stop_codon:yes gene_type:complete
MKEQSILNKVRELLGMEIKLEERKLDDGVTRIEADAFEPEAEVFIITEDDQRIALPIGEYKLDDGMILIVAEEGIIAEIKEEEVVEEVVEEDVVEEEVEAKTEEAVPVKKTVESIVKETFFTEIENLKKENEELKAEVEQLAKVKIKEETVELSKEDGNTNEMKLNEELDPAVKPISFNPENKNEKETFLYGQKRTQTTLDRVFKKLNK